MDIKQAGELTKQRTQEAAREKAEIFQARKQAEAAHGWYQFLKKHSGMVAVTNNNSYYDCQANTLLMEESIKQQPDPSINLESLEAAFQACYSRLAQSKPTEYVRRADSSETRFVKQQVTRPPEVRRLPYTKEQVLDMSKNQIRQLMAMGHTEELNRILRS